MAPPHRLRTCAAQSSAVAGTSPVAPAPAQMRPSEKIAPRWAFTPSVAAVIADSAAIPIARSVERSAPRAPAAASRVKKGRIAAALCRSVSASMSSWLPLSTGLTKPGFGQVCSSSIMAS